MRREVGAVLGAAFDAEASGGSYQDLALCLERHWRSRPRCFIRRHTLTHRMLVLTMEAQGIYRTGPHAQELGWLPMCFNPAASWM